MAKKFASAIYTGQVRHRRFTPNEHAFNYHVFMMYLDTRELDDIFSLSPLWSTARFAPVRFCRRDFHLGASQPDATHIPSVDEAVRTTLLSHTGIKFTGPIRMLVNLRYWGYNMNPLSTYYCFDETGEQVLAILAEVHNTPWGERHAYVLSGEDFAKKQQVHFGKAFHVSPFNPMAMTYQWYSTTPSHTLAIHLENWQSENKIMDATLTLQREELTATAMNKILIRFPWMTVKVIAAIYWQAFVLWCKGVPLFNHPGSRRKMSLGEERSL